MALKINNPSSWGDRVGLLGVGGKALVGAVLSSFSLHLVGRQAGDTMPGLGIGICMLGRSRYSFGRKRN